MQQDIVIIGVGMVTSLGLNAEQTAASVHAGLSAFEETPIMDKAFEPFVMASLPDDALSELHHDLVDEPGLTYREIRMLRLAGSAIGQACDPLGDGAKAIPLFVGLPEGKTQIDLQATPFIEKLAVQCKNKFDQNKSKGIVLGRASGLTALQLAIADLQKNNEKVVLAGGVDSYRDLYILATLDMESRVNSSHTMDGFIPGEGAAFLLLTTAEHAAANGYQRLGRIIGASVGEEIGHMYSEEPYKGEGLARTIQNLFAGVNGSTGKISTVFSSMNGENHFAKEWGVSYLRNTGRIDDEYRIEHPADCFGDTGAACGPIMIGLALAGFQNEYLDAPALVYASSDHASRAACIVSK